MKRTVKEYKRTARALLSGKYGLVVGASLLSGLFVYGLALLAAALFMIGIGGTVLLRQYGTGFAGAPQAAALPAVPVFSAGFAIAFAAVAILAAVLWFLLSIGRTKLWLNICRKRRYGIGDLFYAFRRGSHPLRYLGVCAMTVLIILGLYAVLLGVAVAVMLTVQRTAALIVFLVLWSILVFYVLLGLSFAGTLVIDRPETRVMQALGQSWKMMRGRRLRFLWLSISFIFWGIPEYLSFGIASLWIDPYIGFSALGFYLDALGEREALPEFTQELKAEDSGQAAAQAPGAGAYSDREPGDMPKTNAASMSAGSEAANTEGQETAPEAASQVSGPQSQGEAEDGKTDVRTDGKEV